MSILHRGTGWTGLIHGAGYGPRTRGPWRNHRAFEAIVGHLVSTLEELEVPQEVIDQITTAISPLRFEIVSA